MNSITPRDSLALLLTLPSCRLCQMLCVLSGQCDLDKVWALLVWIEAERAEGPPLSASTRARWVEALFPGGSLGRLLNPDRRFDPTVFELITQSVFAPLMRARGRGPHPQKLADTVAGWDAGSEHPALAVHTFAEALPMPARLALLSRPNHECLRAALDRSTRAPEHQRTFMLLQVLLYLIRQGYLSRSRLLDLYVYENLRPDRDWDRILDGLEDFMIAARTGRFDP